MRDRHATRPVRASRATSAPSDHRLTTTGTDSTATTPTNAAGHRRYAQKGLSWVRELTGLSAQTRLFSAYTRIRLSTMSGADVSTPMRRNGATSAAGYG